MWSVAMYWDGNTKEGYDFLSRRLIKTQRGFWGFQREILQAEIRDRSGGIRVIRQTWKYPAGGQANSDYVETELSLKL